MRYAQQDMTSAEMDRIDVIAHPSYEIGFREGYDMALAKYGIREGSDDVA